MTAPIINFLDCPCCSKELYRTVKQDKENRLMVGSAALQSDRHGPFMVCPHCSCRVILRSAGVGFDLAETQTCIPVSGPR